MKTCPPGTTEPPRPRGAVTGIWITRPSRSGLPAACRGAPRACPPCVSGCTAGRLLAPGRKKSESGPGHAHGNAPSPVARGARIPRTPGAGGRAPPRGVAAGAPSGREGRMSGSPVPRSGAIRRAVSRSARRARPRVQLARDGRADPARCIHAPAAPPGAPGRGAGAHTSGRRQAAGTPARPCRRPDRRQSGPHAGAGRMPGLPPRRSPGSGAAAIWHAAFCVRRVLCHHLIFIIPDKFFPGCVDTRQHPVSSSSRRQQLVSGGHGCKHTSISRCCMASSSPGYDKPLSPQTPHRLIPPYPEYL